MTSECLTQRLTFGRDLESAELLPSTDVVTLWTFPDLTSSCLVAGRRLPVHVLSTKAPKSNAITSKSGRPTRCHGRKASTLVSLLPHVLDTLRQLSDHIFSSLADGSTQRPRTKLLSSVSALPGMRVKLNRTRDSSPSMTRMVCQI